MESSSVRSIADGHFEGITREGTNECTYYVHPFVDEPNIILGIQAARGMRFEQGRVFELDEILGKS